VLLRERGDAVVAIGQASHAWLAGQLARRWGNERFPPPSPHEEVCLAAEQHDIGMAEWDVRPSLNTRTGLPLSFMEMPVPVHVGLWSAAPTKVLSQSRYAALLVSMHGTALNERRDLTKLDDDDRKLVARYLTRQRELQRTLARQIGADPLEIARNQQLVWTWDSISLAVCLRWPSLTLEQVPSREGPADLRLEPAPEGRYTLTPWPFAGGQVEVHCEGRLLERRCHGEDELYEALQRAPAVTVRATLSAPNPERAHAQAPTSNQPA
jgi:hypothetical protein